MNRRPLSSTRVSNPWVFRSASVTMACIRSGESPVDTVSSRGLSATPILTSTPQPPPCDRPWRQASRAVSADSRQPERGHAPAVQDFHPADQGGEGAEVTGAADDQVCQRIPLGHHVLRVRHRLTQQPPPPQGQPVPSSAVLHACTAHFPL